jgi:hypothetical protein
VKVKLLTTSGKPQAKAKVSLHLTGGRLSGPVTAVTNAQGIATFSNLTVNTAGHVTLVATAAGQTASQALTIQ